MHLKIAQPKRPYDRSPEYGYKPTALAVIPTTPMMYSGRWIFSAPERKEWSKRWYQARKQFVRELVAEGRA